MVSWEAEPTAIAGAVAEAWAMPICVVVPELDIADPVDDPPVKVPVIFAVPLVLIATADPVDVQLPITFKRPPLETAVALLAVQFPVILIVPELLTANPVPLPPTTFPVIFSVPAEVFDTTDEVPPVILPELIFADRLSVPVEVFLK
jgi:hypothetical protein